MGVTGFTLDVYGHVLPGQRATAALAVADLVDKLCDQSVTAAPR
jgi:hypothetical protein